MKKYISILTSLLVFISVSHAQYDTQLQDEGTPFVLPPNPNLNGIVRYDQMPAFSLPSGYSVLSTGGPIRDLARNIFKLGYDPTDVALFNDRVEQVNHGWTHTDYRGFSYNRRMPSSPTITEFTPYNTPNIPESKRVFGIYLDNIIQGMGYQTIFTEFGGNITAFDNNAFNQLDVEIGNQAGGYNASMGDTHDMNIIHAEYVWINLEKISIQPPFGHPDPGGYIGYYMNTFYPGIVQTLRNHMRPTAKLFFYGLPGAIDLPPNYSYAMDFDGSSYQQMVSNTRPYDVFNGNPSVGHAYTPYNWHGGNVWTDVTHSCIAPYPMTLSCPYPYNSNDFYSNYCDTVSEAKYGNIALSMVGIEFHKDKIAYRLSNAYTDDDLIANTHVAAKDLMYMTSLYYFPAQDPMPSFGAPRTFLPVKTLDTEDAKAAAIFPFMMGQKEICTWIDPMQNGFPQWYNDSTGSVVTGGTPGYTRAMMDKMLVESYGKVYEDFTNGMYMFSQFKNLFNGSEIYFDNGQKIYDWAAECKCAETNNTWTGLCASRYPGAQIKPFWRGIFSGDYMLIAIQNPFQAAGQTSTHQITVTLPNGDPYTTDPFTLTGKQVRLLLYCIKWGGCDLDATDFFPFSGTAREKGIQLTWDMSTNQQENIKRFEVEKLQDNAEFETIGELAFQNGQANYELIDEHPFSGANTYRLKSIHDDNTFSYTTAIEVIWNQALKMEVYPNPADDKLNFQLNAALEGITVSLYDAQGKLVNTYVSESSKDLFSIDIKNLPAGVYFYQFKAEDQELRGKVVVE